MITEPAIGVVSNSVPTSATVHVLFCADRRFLQHAAAAALSVVTAARSRPVSLHILSCDADDVAEATLRQALSSCRSAKVFVYKVEPERLAGLFIDRHLTKEAYLRFLAPEILPKDVRRVVYLDCDLIVLDDIAKIFVADLGGKAVGAVADCAWTDVASQERLCELGLGPEHVYVNSGVLVMDLDRWRREGLTDRLLRFATVRGPRLLRHDQDALNAVLKDEIRLLDRRWNLQVLLLSRWAKRHLPQDFAATAEARRRPGILHFSTAEKPWQFRAWTRRKALYFRFLDRTPWRHERPPGLTPAQRLEYDLSRCLLRVGLDIYVAKGAWRRLSRGVAPSWGALFERARSFARASTRL